MLTTSNPAARRASIALGGARKANCLLARVPPTAMAVSRLPTARSAPRITSANGPTAVAGSASSRARLVPSKFMSPANAIVTASPLPVPSVDAVRGSVASVDGSSAGRVVVVEAASEAGASPRSPR